MIQFKEDARGVTFAVRIVPRASRSEIAGEHEGAFRIRVAAPPVEGAANRELIRLLAKKFKFPQGSVEIVSGETSKNKVVRINGATLAQLTSIK
ncbi:MAG: YggU family protein [Acidobacteria bacterium]|nr:MAG: YggU family protein [Acidobacteriota bacterium]